MNIEERKLVLIESFIRQEKKDSHDRNLKPMSLKEFHEMIDLAEQDSDAGRVISHKDLQEKVKTWK